MTPTPPQKWPLWNYYYYYSQEASEFRGCHWHCWIQNTDWDQIRVAIQGLESHHWDCNHIFSTCEADDWSWNAVVKKSHVCVAVLLEGNGWDSRPLFSASSLAFPVMREYTYPGPWVQGITGNVVFSFPDCTIRRLTRGSGSGCWVSATVGLPW